jgi:sulfite exporter TauE/SafE
MNNSLWLAALVMGWVGSPHCVAMCGPVCATQSKVSDQLAFQLGRMSGYAVAGALAGWSIQTVGSWSIHVQSLRPLWSFLHALFLIMGVWMLIRGDQPGFLVHAAAKLWRWMQARVQTRRAGGKGMGSLLLGAVWVFWPCGLLYSALTLAALSGSAWQGALTMVCFALGSGVVLSLLPWLWQRLQAWRNGESAQQVRQWGIRAAGGVLATMSAWALWQGLVMNQAPWCVTPP